MQKVPSVVTYLKYPVGLLLGTGKNKTMTNKTAFTNKTTFKVNYAKIGSSTPEEYRHVRVLNHYGSKDCVNLGMTVLVPERKWAKDSGIRRFDYYGIKSMELEVTK